MGNSITAAEASSFYSLTQEASLGGENSDEEDLELKAEKALACPCIAELREGPCGKEFSNAFVCFIKSTEEHKGSDCVESFLTMQACMLENPNAFSRHKPAPEDHTADDEGHKTDDLLPASTVSKG